MAEGQFLIVGGGLVGVACALRLQERGFAVSLIDRGEAQRGASYGNAGHLAAEQCEPLASPQTLLRFPSLLFGFGGPLDFRWRDAARWGPWAMRFAGYCTASAARDGTLALSALTDASVGAWQRLLGAIGAPDMLQTHGHVVLWMDAQRARNGVAAWRKAKLGAASFRELSASECADYGSVLRAAPAGGIRFGGTGQVRDPQGLRETMLAALRARGAAIVTGEAVRVDSEPGAGVTVRLASGEALRAEHGLIAAGAWSAALLGGLGVRAPLIAERGYHVQSAEHAWPAEVPTTVFEERAVVVSRFNSGLRATSFVEFGAADAPGDARKWAALRRHLRALGVAFSDAPAQWVGPRPTLPDYLPAIGRLRDRPNLFYAFGHQHLGLTLAAITAEAVAQLACGAEPAMDCAPYRIERFG